MMTHEVSGTIDDSKIIGSCPGAGTGDTIYKTADGRIWTPSKPGAPATGETRSQIRR